MFKNRRVLAVVPARGGSKGVRLKNLREIRGRSLVALVGDVVREVAEIDRAVISTDHPAIAAAGEKVGLAAPFVRPLALSGDRVADLEVLQHALSAAEEFDGTQYDVVVMLQPTSPLRRASDVVATIHMLVDGGWDSVWTVSPTDSKAHPLKQLTVIDGALDYYDPNGAQIVARQQLSPLYHRNGVAYALTRSCLLEQKTIKGQRAGALIIDGESISIDTEYDLELAEFKIGRAHV